MIVLNTKLWKDHHIIKVSGSSQFDWKKPDSSLITQCALDQIKSYLLEAIKNGNKMILIVDLSKVSFPPWMQVLNIARFFVSLKSLIVEGLDFSIIYTATEEQKTWIKRILMIYTPSRPVHLVETKDEIRRTIKKERR